MEVRDASAEYGSGKTQPRQADRDALGCPGPQFMVGFSARPSVRAAGIGSDERPPGIIPDIVGIPSTRAFDSFHFNGRLGRLADFVSIRCRTRLDQWALDGSCCTCHKVAGHCVSGNAGSLFRSKENGVHGMSHSTFVACVVLSFEIFSRDPRQTSADGRSTDAVDRGDRSIMFKRCAVARARCVRITTH
jgi:hypothetical protein